MAEPKALEHLPVVVIGGGQSGLAAGYHLKRARVPFAILDRYPRVGDSWRRRWSTLKLFTPARIDGLPGMRFPAAPDEHPTKEAMAAYLEDYARRFDLPVRSGVEVRCVERRDGLFEIGFEDGNGLTARQVVVATGANQKPWVPAFAADLNPGIKQLTTATYTGPSDLAPGAVLVVGAGNSGSEIALEAVGAGHPVYLSGRDTGQGNPKFFSPLIWWLGRHLLTPATPMGRKMAKRMAAHGAPRFWITPEELRAAGIERVGRTVDSDDGRPRLDSGSSLDVGTVVWCTGFRHDFSWITPLSVDDQGTPRHRAGVSTTPGLYFLGLAFQRSITSVLVGGAGADSEYVVRRLVRENAALAS